MEPLEIPGSLLDRLRSQIGPRREVWVLAAVVAALALGGIALWARGAPARIAPPAVEDSAPEPSATPEVEGVVVHVAGKVRHPGLYTLPSGARVADAIEAAGGPRAGADLDLLNLAELLVDGTKVEVLGAGAAPSVSSTTPVTPNAPAVININTADQITLEEIPGIGPVKAAAIIEHRDASGPFTAVEGLLEVTGIGPATLESLRPYVAV
ncbi:MAG: ComEA family DNA-binding protein [Actinobacteria bacterium]|nr:ComEA family DNA-binding protein [Actinomycetota bacterium]